MKDKTYQALQWIVGILNACDVPYQIGGGTACYVYGSDREINDIDISISGSNFIRLQESVKDYVIAGPKHYRNEKWDCVVLSLQYKGQDIDLSDRDTLLMRNKQDTEWIRNKHIYDQYPAVQKQVKDTMVVLMHPRVLLRYKRELSGEHQEADVAFLETYIEKNKL